MGSLLQKYGENENWSTSSRNRGGSKSVQGSSWDNCTGRSQKTVRMSDGVVTKKDPKVLHRGTVLSVNYEKCFGFLQGPVNGTATPASSASVFFRVSPPGKALTSTLTGGMVLIRGDNMEYELIANVDIQKPRAQFAWLRECKPRAMGELLNYVKSLITTAEEHPEIVLRDITKCFVGFKLVLDCRNPSTELLLHILQLCQILSSCKLAGLYHSRLTQMYALFCGSQFLTSEHGVRKLTKCLNSTSDSPHQSDSSELLKTFLLHLLERIPSQLRLILPLLSPLAACQKPGICSAVSSSCEAEIFARKILNVLAGGSSERFGVFQPWSQLSLLPTLEEVRAANRSHSSLPVVKKTGPYSSPEEYIDTYLRLLREDSVAGLLKGMHALRSGKLDDCDLKLWFHVSTIGAHFSYNSSPGLTLGVKLPMVKSAKSYKVPLGGSLVCFFDDSGSLSFDSPIWGVVSRCEESDDKTCHICFVDIVVENGVETDSASWSFQCTRLIRGEDMVMAEGPTYFKAYKPVLEALQLFDPDKIPFREELVFVSWPEDPAPEYLKRSSGATLDWSCIFEGTKTSVGGEIRGEVGDLNHLLKCGYKTTFDSSQLEAVQLAVSNRLTIIQGPPGTGKTYVGVKLLQLLLSASTFPQDSPVFVITYKNHALDQFLEKCLPFCEDCIVRVGGRSKSTVLEKFNLNSTLISRDDEFRVDYAENAKAMQTIRCEMEDALADVNRCIQSFEPQMILGHVPELHLNYFLRGVSHPSRIETFVRKLPEGSTLGQCIQGKIPENVDYRDIVYFKDRLATEIRKWIPNMEVLRTAQAYFSLKASSCSKILQAQSVSFGKDKILDEEQDESEREEVERRSAYESVRQDINLESEANQSTKATTYKWISSNFVKFSKEKDVHQRSVTYHQLNLENIGSQFDWLAYEDPYELVPEHLAILVLKLWQESVNAASDRLAKLKAEYDTLLEDSEQILERRKLAILQEAKVIGMTTTGAAIHRSVLKHLSPAVVLVEEAAEILEPQVLASLTSNIQHLILIGDHHQLRPQVESYDLERWHGFGVSMFERLVEYNHLPYQPLALQCRMREEFVPMLLPMYPYLRSNSELVSGSRNKAPTFMTKTMYFWSHLYEETSQRSYVNQEEAHMVVALARWMVSELESPESLKILAAYNGQVTRIRKLLGKYSELAEVEVRSIDSFQGAESEIVIVSLVRSNVQGNIGHLSMRNRLCVAASRARCGVYFVGNGSTLSQKSAHWRTLISYIQGLNAISPSIPLCCPRHPDRTAFELSNTAFAQFEPRDVCDYQCKEVLACGHICNLTCHCGPHGTCNELVDFIHHTCGHSQTRMCYENEEKLFCNTKVVHRFEDCGHSTEKECWKVKGANRISLKCQELCGKLRKCGHMCKLPCSVTCESAICEDCREIEKEKERIKKQVLIKAVESKKMELDLEIQKLKGEGDKGFSVFQVCPDDTTARAYFMAKDRVEKYIQPDSKTMVVVTKVQKIENLRLQKEFLVAQKDLANMLESPEWLFYGGSDELLNRIANKGFIEAHSKAHLFDVYSSRIAQKPENHNLLLCEVHLGKAWRPPGLNSPEFREMNRRKLREIGCDSVSLVGDQENVGDMRPFGHIIYSAKQAIPRFIVSYQLMNFQPLAEANDSETFGEEEASRSGGMCRLSLLPSLNFQGLTSEECHFRMAESQFYRMSSNRSTYTVNEVEFIKNKHLEERFNRKKEEFKQTSVAVDTRFVFHGTDAVAIDQIATGGFKIGGTQGVAIRSGAVYGPGVYTAANPDTSVAYCRGSNMMLLSLAIPGVLGTHHKHGHSADVLVIQNVDQLLPRYVVHYS